MNVLKHDLEYSIEVYPHGWLLCAPFGQSGIPMNALNQALSLCPKGSVIDLGIAGALGAIFAVGTPKDLEKWRQQITAQLAQGNSPKEIQWVRGVDCGLSSLALFRRLAKPQAATEASGRLNDVEENPIPRDAEDFARGVRMIEFCGWQSRLNEARDLSPAWEQIIQQWDNLCVMLKAGRNEEIHTFLSGLTA